MYDPIGSVLEKKTCLHLPIRSEAIFLNNIYVNDCNCCLAMNKRKVGFQKKKHFNHFKLCDFAQ